MASRDYDATYDALHTDNRLRPKCEAFLLVKAVPDVQAEPGNTPDHAARLAWANAVEQDEVTLARNVRRLAIKAAQNATIRAAIAAGEPIEDSDLEFVGVNYIPTLVALETP